MFAIKKYNDLANIRKGKYINNNPPSNITTKTDGWTCSEGHTWSATYHSIEWGTWCRKCINQSIITLEDYHYSAKEKNGKYLKILYLITQNILL